MGMDLTTQSIIKLILGIMLFVAVVLGLYFFFKDYINDFFRNLSKNRVVEAPKIVLNILK